jgi:hypothetical protein
MLNFPGHLPLALGSNDPEFPDSCLPTQFAFVEDIHQVLVDRPHILLEKLPDERLRQPNRFILKPALNARAAILGLVEDDFGLGQRFVAHGFSLRSVSVR